MLISFYFIILRFSITSHPGCGVFRRCPEHGRPSHALRRGLAKQDDVPGLRDLHIPPCVRHPAKHNQCVLHHCAASSLETDTTL